MLVLHAHGGPALAAALFATAAPGRAPCDAVPPTSGVLGGGSRSSGFRLILRMLCQHRCGNRTAPGEPTCPPWMGLPERSRQGHLTGGTWHVQDTVRQRTGGACPFGNAGVRCSGSADESVVHQTMQRAGSASHLAQTFTSHLQACARRASACGSITRTS